MLACNDCTLAPNGCAWAPCERLCHGDPPQERNSGQSTIDYPMGGSASIVNALIRGIEKHGGQVLTRAHVDNIHMEGE